MANKHLKECSPSMLCSQDENKRHLNRGLDCPTPKGVLGRAQLAQALQTDFRELPQVTSPTTPPDSLDSEILPP